MSKDYMTSDEASKHHKVSVNTIYRWGKENKLKTVREPGQKIMFSRDFNYATVTKDEIPSVVTGVPGFGVKAIPDAQQHVGIYSAGQYFYKQPDEALIASREDAYRMFYDMAVLEPLQHRILSGIQTPWSIEPEDKREPDQVEAAKIVQKIIEEIPDLQKMLMALGFGIFWGRSGVQLVYKVKYVQGRKELRVVDWSNTHGDSIYYKFDEPGERIGILVSPKSLPGTLNLGKLISTDIGLAYVLEDYEREAFIIHTHYRLSSEYLNINRAGSVQGTGLRDKLYWTWYLKSQTAMILQEHLERVGTGWSIYPFELSNDTSYKAALTNATSQAANAIQIYPIAPGSTNPLLKPERVEPGPHGVQNLLKVIEYYDSQIKRYILGQDLTSEAKPTGLGSGVADLQADTFRRYIVYDTNAMGETLTRDLVRVIVKYCFPNCKWKLKWVFHADRPDPEQYMKGVESFIRIGGTVIEDEVRSVLGLTRPTDDDIVLGGKQTDDKVLGVEEANLVAADGEKVSPEEANKSLIEDKEKDGEE